MEIKIYNNNCNKLILFFADWGEDEKPFSHISSSKYDVIVLYNYTTLNFSGCNATEYDSNRDIEECPIHSRLCNYSEINIIAYGAGVWAASSLFGRYVRFLTGKSQFRALRLLKKINCSVAVNGTLCPVSNIWGIQQELFNISLERLQKEVDNGELSLDGSTTYREHIKSIFDDSVQMERYIGRIPNRGVQDILNELCAFKELFTFTNSIRWNKIIISRNDRLFTPGNQRRFWQEYQLGTDDGERSSSITKEFAIEEIDAPHFPFFNYRRWEEILSPVK